MPYARNFLRFLGMSEVELVYAEGLAISPTAKEKTLAKAQLHVDRLMLPQLATA